VQAQNDLQTPILENSKFGALVKGAPRGFDVRACAPNDPDLTPRDTEENAHRERGVPSSDPRRVALGFHANLCEYQTILQQAHLARLAP
jgi:hypothetical protein